MNKLRRTAGCLGVLLALPMASFAVADEEADHAALRALVQEYETAIENADPSVLQPYLASDFSGVMVTGEEIESFDSLQAYWDRIQGLLGDGGKYTVKVHVAQPATIIGDVAFAYGTTDDTAITSSGKEYDFQGFWTAICRRDGEGWKIERIHGSMDAITNTFVAAALRNTAMWSGLVGGLVGFVIGGVLIWPVARRRSAQSIAN